MSAPGAAPSAARLPPAEAIALAARMLAAEGFCEVARNARGDAIYLRPAGCPWHLRVANHARTARQRARRGDILASLVIDRPRSAGQVADAVRVALANFRAALSARRGAGADCPAPGQPAAGASRK